MDKESMDSKLEKLWQLINAVHSIKPVELQARNFYLSFSELLQQTSNTLQKYENKWPEIFRVKFRERIKCQLVINDLLESIAHNIPQQNNISDAIYCAKILYESVFDEYTNSYGAYNNYSRYNEVSFEERKRITEEIFLPHYMLIKFLQNYSDE
jgi:hypothetical protein